MKTILAANDGSESAKRAFQFAIELAKAFGAGVTVVSVAQPSEPPTSVETPALLDAATEHFEKDLVVFREIAKAAGCRWKRPSLSATRPTRSSTRRRSAKPT
jgi:nucleotide-binding universal stress UspA family protein